MSVVAAIVKENGGIRVVVTELWRVQFHVAEGEKVFVLPGRVTEPIAWGCVPGVIERAVAYARERL